MRELLLAKNQLVTLPQDICQLSHLTALDVRNNLIEQLPWQLGQLTNLKSLLLSGNPLQTFPDGLRATATSDPPTLPVQKVIYRAHTDARTHYTYAMHTNTQDAAAELQLAKVCRCSAFCCHI